MVNSVADGDDFLETLDLDSHDLHQMTGTEQKYDKKAQAWEANLEPVLKLMY